ncbi:MAG: DUF2892 domain-containing protein [archaeon]|nr:DUF2892 domain-containing protein [archaeon]MDA0842893.1 DUF2892 domain-containing protein [archaeon]MDA1168558.1 DUF2892 domain-containing protein [archaeon]
MNVGGKDRVLRLMGGSSLLAFDYFASSTWELILLGVGLWGLITSVLGFCPFYTLMGRNTCPQTFPQITSIQE